MKTNTIFLRFPVLFLLSCLLLTSCNNQKDAELKIGVILPITGKLSFMGEQEKNGMIVAQEKFNKGERKIKLIFEDSKSNAKDGVNAAQKLLTIDKVDLIITSTTGVSLAVQPLAEKNQTDMVAFCMEPEITQNSAYVTRLYESVNDEAQAFVDYINNNGSSKKIGILYNKVEAWENVVNQILKPAIQKKGLQLVYEESYPVGEKDLKNIITKLKNANPDHLILLSYGFEFPYLLPQLFENKILPTTTILGGWGFLYPNVSKDLLEGILVSGPGYVFKKDSLANSFSLSYKKLFNNEPNYDAAMAYNAIELIYNNFDKTKVQSGTRFKDLIKNTSVNNSVVGPFEIDNTGAMVIKTSLGKYKNGQIIIEN